MDSERDAFLSHPLSLAMRGPIEATLRSIIESYGWSPDDDLLGSIIKLKSIFDQFDLEIQPSLGTGGLDTARAIAVRSQHDGTALAEADIKAGECARIEFKSTFLLNVREWEKVPRPPIENCRDERMVKSVIKTIAAFLNSDGGTLLIGIRDGGEVFGLEPDIELADKSKQDFDGWELELRKQASKAFQEEAINAYFTVSRCQKDGRTFARVQVARRERLSFIKVGDGLELYVRSGNSSIPVPYIKVQEYFEMKRLYC